MTAPTRCLSSQLTTPMLTWRNQDGIEENWGADHRIKNYWTHIPKVIITEGASVFLITTSTVETVAYATLLVGSLPICLISTVPTRYAYSLMSSAFFTTYWNIGNILIFNLFCNNAITHESFARITIDYWPRGNVLRAMMLLLCIVTDVLSNGVGTLSLLFRDMHYNGENGWTRNEDGLYLVDRLFENPRLAFAFVNNAQLAGLRTVESTLTEQINAGKTFFTTHILNAAGMNADTKDCIEAYDPDVVSFTFSRAIYIYAFGTKRDDPVANFFQTSTQNAIRRMRQDFTQAEGTFLALKMLNLTLFDQEIPERPQRDIFNRIKGIASIESQGGIFGRCWGEAVR